MKQKSFTEEFKNWWIEYEDTYDFSFVCFSYNPSQKAKVKKETFELSDNLSNKKMLAKLVYASLIKNVGKKYRAELFNNGSLWFQRNINYSQKKYLQNKKVKKKYSGSITVSDIYNFVNTFALYPSDYGFPIIVNSLEKELILFMTDHETFFIISKDEKLVNKIGKEIDKNGGTVLFSKNLKKKRVL